VRLDGDEMAADADDGDAGDYSGTYMVIAGPAAWNQPCLGRVSSVWGRDPADSRSQSFRRGRRNGPQDTERRP
jgi:hypothetical protein